MKPKNIPLFYTALIVGMAGLWMFAFTLYWLLQDAGDLHGANIGAGLLGFVSWVLGLVSLVLLIIACSKSPKS